jgi:ATP-dependent DNA helicase 2 subunit 1
MALEEEIPTIPEDKTMPKFRHIHKRAGEFINEWGRALDVEARASQKARYGGIDGTDVKRGSDDDDGSGPPRKKIKVEESDGREQSLASITVDGLKKMIEKGDLKKRVLADLKDFLKARGLSSTGKKPDLIDRIEQWAEEN